jgi:hypothetical protein
MKRFQVYLNSDEISLIVGALALAVHKFGPKDFFNHAKDSEKLALNLAVQTGLERSKAEAIFKDALQVFK